MNRDEFGKLIRALRKDCLDDNGTILSQKQLGLLVGLSAKTISRLENGDDGVKLTNEILCCLADALRLTSGERREFFLAAPGIETEKLMRPSVNSLQVLADLRSLLFRTMTPAFLLDQYADILSINSSLLKLYDIEPHDLPRLKGKARNVNVLRVIFAKEFEAQQKMMGHHWISYAYFNVLDFRMFSLLYRSTPYYVQLIKQLRGYKERKNYPSFKNVWRKLYGSEYDYFCEGTNMKLSTEKWGELEYLAASYKTFTPDGYLQLCIYAPISDT